MFIKVENDMFELVACEFIIEEILYPKEVDHYGKYKYPYFIVFDKFSESNLDYRVVQTISTDKNILATGDAYFLNFWHRYLSDFYECAVVANNIVTK